MRKNPYRGKLIAIEGLDGSGLSTQAKLLKNYLFKKGYKVILTKEPTLDSKAGRKIRQILDKKEKIAPNKLQELFAKDRKEHLKNVITPSLKKGKIVISDRYVFSSFAYGRTQGLSLNRLIKMNNKFLLPDLTLILKVPLQVCIRRIHQRGNEKTLFENKEKLVTVYQEYKNLTKKFKNIKLINGEKPLKEVFSNIKKASFKLI